MFDTSHFDAHERVLQVHDRATGLRAIIAIHSTALGPAAGGCRLWTYPDAGSALTDVLRLSRGMSYKNAMADLPLGGGKSVVLGPVAPEHRSEIFQAFGDAVQSLGGTYITAEDVGVSVSDMQIVASRTPYVSGLKRLGGADSGDPAPYTAHGVRRGIEAVAAHAFGRSDLEGLTVAVQGLGSVGAYLCRELSERGAKLRVADIDPERVERACDTYGAERVSPLEILLADVDVVAPCAMGGVITKGLAKSLRARAIAGAANNQLATSDVGQVLHERGIAYAPDYVINSGGIIKASAEYLRDRSEDDVNIAIDQVHTRVAAVLCAAKAANRPSSDIADKMAKVILDRAEKQRKAA